MPILSLVNCRNGGGVDARVPVVPEAPGAHGLGQARGEHQGRGEGRETGGRRGAEQAVPADLRECRRGHAARNEQVVCELTRFFVRFCVNQSAFDVRWRSVFCRLCSFFSTVDVLSESKIRSLWRVIVRRQP